MWPKPPQRQALSCSSGKRSRCRRLNLWPTFSRPTEGAAGSRRRRTSYWALNLAPASQSRQLAPHNLHAKHQFPSRCCRRSCILVSELHSIQLPFAPREPQTPNPSVINQLISDLEAIRRALQSAPRTAHRPFNAPPSHTSWPIAKRCSTASASFTNFRLSDWSTQRWSSR